MIFCESLSTDFFFVFEGVSKTHRQQVGFFQKPTKKQNEDLALAFS